jgi:hypothetical protein
MSSVNINIQTRSKQNLSRGDEKRRLGEGLGEAGISAWRLAMNAIFIINEFRDGGFFVFFFELPGGVETETLKKKTFIGIIVSIDMLKLKK